MYCNQNKEEVWHLLKSLDCFFNIPDKWLNSNYLSSQWEIKSVTDIGNSNGLINGGLIWSMINLIRIQNSLCIRLGNISYPLHQYIYIYIYNVIYLFFWGGRGSKCLYIVEINNNTTTLLLYSSSVEFESFICIYISFEILKLKVWHSNQHWHLYLT